MKLKIVYDGTDENTKVIDKATGEQVEGIIAVNIVMEPFLTLATLTFAEGIEFELDNVEAKVDGNSPRVQRGPSPPNNREDIEQVSSDV